MSAPPALLGFFRQEATEYLDRLDQLLAGDELIAPDGASFLAQARALRGAASMTRLGGLPELASTVERIAGGLRDGELRWDQRLHFAVRGALAELRALVHKSEQWTEGEHRQARTHSVALAAVAAGYLASLSPAASPASPVVPIARLFPDDGAPGLVERNPTPPITLAERFRSDMSAAADGVARESANLAIGERGPQQLALTDALRRALLGLSDVAESYGATSIATLAMRMARSAMEHPPERIAIQSFAQLLMDRELTEPELAARVRDQSTTWPGTDAVRGATPRARAPVATAAIPAARPALVPLPTPSVVPPALSSANPSANPPAGAVTAEPAGIIAIESLLYDGSSALARACVVRDELRLAWQRAGGTSLDPTAAALLDELSDLLDLAVAR